VNVPHYIEGQHRSNSLFTEILEMSERWPTRTYYRGENKDLVTLCFMDAPLLKTWARRRSWDV